MAFMPPNRAMPSFLITDILSHESHANSTQTPSDYTTDQESLSISPSTADTGLSTDASLLMMLQQYLAQSPATLRSMLPDLLCNHKSPNGTDMPSHMLTGKEDTRKTQPLIEVLIKQASLLMQGTYPDPIESDGNFPRSILSNTRSGAFHPVKRGSNSSECSARYRTRSSSNPNPYGAEGSRVETDVMDRSHVTCFAGSTTMNVHSNGRSHTEFIPSKAPGTKSLDTVIARGIEDSSQGSDDESSTKGPRSQYGSNSALDALIHMTTSSMRRLNRKVEKQINPTDRLDLGTLTRSTPMTKRRKTRTTFSNSQLSELENNFNRQKYLTPTDRDRIAKHLGLSNTQVITWFQNRRAKLKREAEELERDILAARQQEQQKLFELHSQESEDGTGSGFERLGASERWNSIREERARGKGIDLPDPRLHLSKSPNHWSDSSPVSVPLNKNKTNHRSIHSNIINNNNNNSNELLPSVVSTINRLMNTKSKPVWSPAEELEGMIT